MTTEIELAGAVSIYLALSANLARLSYQLVLTGSVPTARFGTGHTYQVWRALGSTFCVALLRRDFLCCVSCSSFCSLPLYL